MNHDGNTIQAPTEASPENPGLWTVREDPARPGTYVGLAQVRGGKLVSLESGNRASLEKYLIQMQDRLVDDGEDRFLHAWKRGVKLAGASRFHNDAESIDAATDKEQLRPRWEAIEEYIRAAISPGERLFVMELCSFYNSQWMHEQKKKLRLKRSSIGQAAYRLDAERREVLADLLVSYRGW